MCRITSAIRWRSSYIYSNCSCCSSSDWNNRVVRRRIWVWIKKNSLIIITSTTKCNRLRSNCNAASSSKRVSTNGYDQITSSVVVGNISRSKLSQRRCARICNCSISLLSQSMVTRNCPEYIIDDVLKHFINFIICPDSFGNFSLNMIESYWISSSINVECRCIPHMIIRTIADILNKSIENVTNIIFTVYIATRNNQRGILLGQKINNFFGNKIFIGND